MSERAIFLDRDNTLIEDPGYINNPEQVILLEGVASALLELRRMGYKLIVASNQSGVARGIVTEEVLSKIHERLQQLLAEGGVRLDGIYYCPYHPEGVVRKYRKDSEWRKPKPGMLLAAAKELNIDLSQSWAIGNSGRDIEAGHRAGCKTVLVDDISHTRKTEPSNTEPDYRAINIREAVNIIKKHDRNTSKQENHKASDAAMFPEAITEDLERIVNLEGAGSAMNLEGTKTENLLNEILEQLKRNRRTEMFGEFSIMRLMAGIVQIIVLFCLLVSIWFLMSPNKQINAVFISLGFAVVFQVMALTLYIMHGHK